MHELPQKLWEYYLDEEYQNLAHVCLDLIQSGALSGASLEIVGLIHKYALACDEWEKSYNFSSIISRLSEAEDGFVTLNLDDSDYSSVHLALAAMCHINIVAVNIENSMLFNDPKQMLLYSEEGVSYMEDILNKIPEEGNELLGQLRDLLESYLTYVSCWGQYGDVYVKYRDQLDYVTRSNEVEELLKSTIHEMLTDGDRITSSEMKGLLANLKTISKYWSSGDPTIHLNKVAHYLSTSFYTSNAFASDLIDTHGLSTNSIISDYLFEGKINIVSAGIDGLDDFLQTSVGEAYGDVFHLLLEGGTIHIKQLIYQFNLHLYLRRFGVGTVVIEIEADDQSVSDFRMFQTLIGPQAGISNISWHDESFSRLNDLNQYIHSLIARSHKIWAEKHKLLHVLQMETVPYDSDRTWFARSVIHEATLLKDGNSTPVETWKDLERSYEFKGLNTPLLEGRPSLDDWIQIPNPEVVNLAEIRLHEDDLILFDTHTLLVFLPSKPEFILQGVLSTAMLVTDISTLINSFDIMAEHVRSDLINQIQQAKQMLEQVEIDKIKTDLKLLRRNVIEVTEFELLALQSIQLLKSQSTIKYPDHAKFVMELISRSTISSTIISLEQKISIIKESQEGILRTADDLVSKYQEEVSESQQRLVRVITLIGAGVAQITIIDDILAVFQSQGWLAPGSAESIKLGVIILAFLLSGVAISWLGLGYLNSKRKIFES